MALKANNTTNPSVRPMRGPTGLCSVGSTRTKAAAWLPAARISPANERCGTELQIFQRTTLPLHRFEEEVFHLKTLFLSYAHTLTHMKTTEADFKKPETITV